VDSSTEDAEPVLTTLSLYMDMATTISSSRTPGELDGEKEE
jgi:hypothetical protein